MPPRGREEVRTKGVAGYSRILPAFVVNLVLRRFLLIFGLADLKDLGFIKHRTVEAEDSFLDVVGKELLRSCGRHSVRRLLSL